MEGLGIAARFAHFCMRPGPSFVLGQTIGDFVPGGLGADPKVAFRPVVWCLIQGPKGNADLVWIVVVRADEARSTHPAEMLYNKLG
jgi:hypothetical protein